MTGPFFGLRVNTFDASTQNSDTNGNAMTFFPQDDVLDTLRGAGRVPEQVTHARRLGQQVVFIQPIISKHMSWTWYWKMPDGTSVAYAHGNSKG